MIVALNSDEEAKEKYETLPYSHKVEYIRWIEEAKKPETRINRITKTLRMLKKVST